MSVSSSEILFYGAGTTVPDSDTGTMGGSILTSVRYVFESAVLANTLADTVEVLSSAAGDSSQVVTVTGRSSSGAIISENFNLAGTTVQNGATTFQRILKITINNSHTGNITIRKASDNSAIAIMESGVLQLRTVFYNASSNPSGGATKNYYEKIFIKNTNSSLDLLSAVISEQTDSSASIAFDLEDAVADNNSIASRLDTIPTGMLGSFDSSAKSVPGGSIPFGSAIGCWLRLTLAGGASAILDTYTIRTAGSSI